MGGDARCAAGLVLTADLVRSPELRRRGRTGEVEGEYGGLHAGSRDDVGDVAPRIMRGSNAGGEFAWEGPEVRPRGTAVIAADA